MSSPKQTKNIFSSSNEDRKFFGTNQIVSGFSRFLKERLQQSVASRYVHSWYTSEQNMDKQPQQNLTIRNNTYFISKSQNVAESCRQRDEFWRMLSQRPTLRSSSNTDDEIISTSEMSQQQILRPSESPEPQNLGDSEQGQIVDPLIQGYDHTQIGEHNSPQTATIENIQQLTQQFDMQDVGSFFDVEDRNVVSVETEQQLLAQQRSQLQREQSVVQQQVQQQPIANVQQLISQQQESEYRAHVAAEAQQLLQQYLDEITHTSSSRVPSSFGVQNTDSCSDEQQQQPLNLQQNLSQPQPVAEAGPGSTQQQQQPQQPNIQSSLPTVKYEKPVTFNGKHSETENFIFSMQAYVHALKMTDREAAEFLTLYLRGDAMTWWRSYCTTNGGLTNVFNNKSFSDLLNELRTEFSDVDRLMQLRNKLFNIRQTQSVQQYVTLFRNTMVDLGPGQITADTAKHLFLYGLKPHIRKEVFMHRPSTFADMLLLAERADQAFMADRTGILQSKNQFRSNQGSFGRGGFVGGRSSFVSGRGGSSGRVQGNNGQNINWQNVSQYGDQSYKGPAPMVLGNAQGVICHYCGKSGHFQRECYKRQNDLAGRGGQANRGRHNGGRGGGRSQQKLNTLHGAADVDEVMKLGLVAMNNKLKQQQSVGQGSGKKQVTFNQVSEDNHGQISNTKN